MPGKSRTYTQRHFRDIAGLLAAERAANGASPALNRITDAFITLFTEDSKDAAQGGGAYFFRPELFRAVALGEKPVNSPAPKVTRPRRTAASR